MQGRALTRPFFMHLNVEIKARVASLEPLRAFLLANQARFVGIDHQKDTYFRVSEGRLKLRQGNIERSLIFYRRNNQAGPKKSEVFLHPVSADDTTLNDLLQQALQTDVVVEKTREIYFIDNVKFHLDRVEGLGCFAEIEAIDADGTRGEAELHAQCNHYMQSWNIQPADLLTESYSDMLRGS